MNRVFERAGINDGKKELLINERIKVGVAGCGICAGASFVATALALLAARTSGLRVAFVQLDGGLQGIPFGIMPQADCTLQKVPYAFAADDAARIDCARSLLQHSFSYRRQNTNLYDALGMDKRFAGRKFIDFFDLVARGISIKGVQNLDEKINWALQVPESQAAHNSAKYACNDLRKCGLDHSLHKIFVEPKAALSAEDKCIEDEYLLSARLVNNIAGDFTVCDFGSGSYVNPLYYDMDTLICVLDPLPSKLLGSAALIEELKLMEAKGHKVIWILNKNNGGINRRELRDFLGNVFARVHIIPLIDEKLFYSAEYNCEIPFAKKEICENVEVIFKEILKSIFVVGRDAKNTGCVKCRNT